jgi:uncharacterized protein
MRERNFNLHNGKSGAALTVRVIPRASRDEIHEILDDGTVKVRLAGAQNAESANQALIDFLAAVLQVPAGQLEVVAGLSGNDKLVTVIDLDKAQVQERILKALA